VSNDQGPIEYVGDRGQRRRDRRQQRLSEPSAAATPTPAARARRPWSGLAVTLAVVGALVAGVLYYVYATRVRHELGGLACDLTACGAEGMTAAGWLVVLVPTACLSLLAVLWRRMSGLARTVASAVTLPLAFAALTFVPRGDTDLDEVITGPAGRQFAEGIRWAMVGIGAALAVLALLGWLSTKLAAVRRVFNPTALAAMAVAIAASLPLAISQAEPTFVTSDSIFPSSFRASGDTLTRFVSADEPGCADVVDDAAPLRRNGCQLTVVGGYRTDDSDAEAIVTAVLFGSERDARDARAGLPAEPGPAGRRGDSITVMSTTGAWLLVGRVHHAGREPITAEERGWLLWTLKQVSYRFISVQQGLLVGPSPADGIAPRTP
jgi:hypothetical protein